MEIQQKLQQISIGQNENLKDHCDAIIQKMILNDEQNPLYQFEKYSESLLKNKKLKQSGKLIFDDKEEMKNVCENLRKFLGIERKKVKVEGEEEDEEEEQEKEPENLGQVQNLLENEEIMNQTGQSLGEKLCFYLQLSIKKFIKKYQPTKVEFWGRIFTQHKDYFILKIEAEIEREEEKEIQEDHEERGTGINKDIYFVTNDILSENWKELPVITSKQMRQARKLEYIFTGNLDFEIISTPIFDGKEIHYLKAQITRIDHSTQIIPKGIYNIVEDEESVFKEIEKVEEYVKPKLNFYWNKQNWVHFKTNILNQGRLKHQELRFAEDEEIEEEEKDKITKFVHKLDSFENRLKSIENDKSDLLQEIWKESFYGNFNIDQDYITKQPICEGIYKIDNLLWPGFSLFSNQDNYFSIYQGYGNKYKKEIYYPKFELEIPLDKEDQLLSKEE